MIKRKWAELFTNLSDQEASPNALRKEKHEQFTPMEDVNLHHLFSYVLNLANFLVRETRIKIQVYYVLSLHHSLAVSGTGNISY